MTPSRRSSACCRKSARARVLDPEKLPLLRGSCWKCAGAALDEDLGALSETGDRRLPHPPGALPGRPLPGHRARRLHVLGRPPEGEQREHLLDAMVRLAPEPSRLALRARLDGLLDRTSDEREAVLSALEGAPRPGRSQRVALPRDVERPPHRAQLLLRRSPGHPLPSGVGNGGAPPGGRPHRALLPGARTPPPHRRPRHLGAPPTCAPTATTSPRLALLGVRPLWRPETGRVIGVEAVPLADLGRPRVGVTVHLSGFFGTPSRTWSTSSTGPCAWSPRWMGSRRRTIPSRTRAAGSPPPRGPRHRLFGSKPGCYGAGLPP